MPRPWLQPAEPLPYAELSFLVIDDNQIMRQWLQSVVAITGAKKVDQAASFSAALRMIKAGKTYHVVLCDYILGDGRDGQQLLEEVRRNQLLPVTSVWIMVTGEREYLQVFSAAELLPDDYLIKPFKPAMLQERVDRALRRAMVLSEPNHRLYAGDYQGCVVACEAALTKGGAYSTDLRRLAGEALLRGNENQRAHDHYVALIEAGNDLPWARLGLARACFHMERNDEAHDLLELLILDSPEYLHAHDWMARIQERLGNPEVAKEILAETLEKNPKALWRHREIVRVSLDTGDTATALQAYEALHQHGRGSSFLTPGDFSGYARLLVSQASQIGGEVAGKLRQLYDLLLGFFGREPRFAFARAVVEHARAQVAADVNAEAQAYARLKALARHAVESNDRLSLLGAAIRAKDMETMYQIALALFLDHQKNEQMLAQIRDLFPPALRDTAIRAEQEAKQYALNMEAKAIALAQAGDLEGAIAEFDRLVRERPNLSILYNAGVAVAKWIEVHGWQTDKGRLLDRYLRSIEAIDPSSLKLKRLKEFRSHLPTLPGTPGG